MPMKTYSFPFQRVVLIILFALITLSFFYSPGTPDVRLWLKWIQVVDANGPLQSFETGERSSVGVESVQEAYPPYISLILFITAQLTHLFSIDYFTALKLSLTLFLFLSSFIFWIWTRDFFITAILHISLMVNSMLLVYVDIFLLPTLMLSLWAIKRRNMITFTVFYTISCLIKWQPIIISPFIFLYILQITKISEWEDIDFKGITLNVMVPLSVILIITILLYKMPFLKSFTSAVTEPYLSGNALNFGWIMTYLLHVFLPDKFGYLIEGQAHYIMTTSFKLMLIPKILFFISYTTAFLVFLKKEKSFENLIYYSLTGYLAYFMFNTGVHENHLFLASILAVILLYLKREYLVTSVFVLITSNLNPIIFYGTDGKGLGFSRVVGIDITLIFSFLNVIFFLLIWNAACIQWVKTHRLN